MFIFKCVLYSFFSTLLVSLRSIPSFLSGNSKLFHFSYFDIFFFPWEITAPLKRLGLEIPTATKYTFYNSCILSNWYTLQKWANSFHEYTIQEWANFFNEYPIQEWANSFHKNPRHSGTVDSSAISSQDTAQL